MPPKIILSFALAFILNYVATAAAFDTRQGVIGKGEAWETSYWVQDSKVAGPTVLVVGGVHGNEPAGSFAAMQIKSWKPIRGKLIVVPRANQLGLAANTRWIPEYRNNKQLRDLNRNFPRKGQSETQTALAQGLWRFATEQKPDWVFDLHEGFDFHRINSKSVGSSVIAFPDQKEFATQIAAKVNQQVDPEKHFDVLAESGPVGGSFARACAEKLGAKSFIFETTFKDQPISKRTRQHRVMVSCALSKLGMLDLPQVDNLGSRSSSNPVVRVGIFDGPGAVAKKLFSQLDRAKNIRPDYLGPEDIRRTNLQLFDVLLFPGGSGSKQGRAIQQSGRDKVRAFVRQGGGVMGICAGAYLCSSHYDWSLHLMNAKVFNQTVEVPGKGRKSMWYRGPAATVQVEINQAGERWLGIKGTFKVRYQNGPIISPDSHQGVPNYRTLAWFRSENGIYEAQKGTMVGRPAAIESEFGKGKVLAISPHFESTPGKESVILHAIEILRQREKVKPESRE